MVLNTEELHQLVMVWTDALPQVSQRLLQLVETEVWVFPVGPQVFLTERGHAGETGLCCLCFHAGITAYESLLFGSGPLCGQAVPLALAGLLSEGVHHGAEDRVFLQLGSGGEVGPALWAAVRVFPCGQEAVLAEVVSTGDRNRTFERGQTDAASQLILQTQQRELNLVSLRHVRFSAEPRNET